jgi:hypothetical protein
MYLINIPVKTGGLLPSSSYSSTLKIYAGLSSENFVELHGVASRKLVLFKLCIVCRDSTVINTEDCCNIQIVPEGKVSILGGHSIGHCKNFYKMNYQTN